MCRYEIETLIINQWLNINSTSLSHTNIISCFPTISLTKNLMTLSLLSSFGHPLTANDL